MVHELNGVKIAELDGAGEWEVNYYHAGQMWIHLLVDYTMEGPLIERPVNLISNVSSVTTDVSYMWLVWCTKTT